MKTKKIHTLLLFTCIAIYGFSQAPVKAKDNITDTSTVNALLQQSKSYIGSNNDSAIQFAQQAKEIADKIDYKAGIALAHKNLGLSIYYKGEYKEAIQNFQESMKLYEQLNDQTGIANILNNMAAIYGEQGNEEKGLELGLRSLSISEKLGNKLRILSALNTIASIYYNKEATKPKALEYLLRALPLCEDIGDSTAIGTISENIGEIYQEKDSFDKAIIYFEKAIKYLGNVANAAFAYNGIGKIYAKQNNYAEALRYHTKALQMAEQLGSKPNIIKSLDGLASTHFKQKDFATALSLYQRATTIAEDMNTVQDLKDLYLGLANTYSQVADYKKAFKYQTLYANIKDTIYNIDTDKKLGRLQFEFDLEKKEGEIKLLTKDKDLQAVSIKRQKFAKNAFMIGLLLAFIIALLIYRSYRIKVKTHKILDQQKNEIENLLLNILPLEIAHELKTTGHATPKHHENVAVMFTDFKGFTSIADKMVPDDLVKELDDCFASFDTIIEKYKLEKIKTIGDSYMCAGGIPTKDENCVLKIIKAGLEIQEYVSRSNIQRLENGEEPWQIRIGVHVGPVVAGVVGKKKYAYDIWGSTVNIASRMESNGEPGKVNISAATYEIIKDYYDCTYRGKISAKNIGDIDMYFIDHEHRIPLTLTLKDSVVNQ